MTLQDNLVIDEERKPREANYLLKFHEQLSIFQSRTFYDTMLLSHGRINYRRIRDQMSFEIKPCKTSTWPVWRNVFLPYRHPFLTPALPDPQDPLLAGAALLCWLSD